MLQLYVGLLLKTWRLFSSEGGSLFAIQSLFCHYTDWKPFIWLPIHFLVQLKLMLLTFKTLYDSKAHTLEKPGNKWEQPWLDFCDSSTYGTASLKLHKYLPMVFNWRLSCSVKTELFRRQMRDHSFLDLQISEFWVTVPVLSGLVFLDALLIFLKIFCYYLLWGLMFVRKMGLWIFEINCEVGVCEFV